MFIRRVMCKCYSDIALQYDIGRWARWLTQYQKNTELGYKVYPRLRELSSRGQREPGGGTQAI